MAIGGAPPTAPREKDGAKGTSGRYGFVAEVQRGYLGALWLARDPSDAGEGGTVFVRHVAPIHTASSRSALLEAARFGQTAGATTLEIIEGRTSVDLVTPFVDAEPLRSLLRTAALKHVPLDASVLLGIARDVLGQLESLHDAARANQSPHGFGGLQPDSILVGTDGRVELIDAGISAAASAREPWKSDVQRIGYFAPEQIDIRGVVDARSDVFALGILLWEAFGNRRLFPGADGKSARERVQKGAIVRLDAARTSNSPGVATPIADLVARALERDQALRFQTAEEMQAAIGALEPATHERIGAWVTALAETAITKRRQLLARSSVAPPAARSSLLPTRPSLRAGAPLGSRSSVPPPTPRPPAPAPAPPQPAQVEPPRSTTPEPPAALAEPPRSATPEPPAALAEPLPAAPEAGLAPEAARETAEPHREGPAGESLSSPGPGEGSKPATPDSTVPTTQPSALGSSDGVPSSTNSPDDGPEADAIDVTDEDLGAPPPPSSRPGPANSRSPSPRTSRPPRLPQDTALDGVGGDTSLLGAPAEPLAGPMPAVSQLAVLTSPQAPRKRGLVLAVGVALVLGIGAGGWWVGRLQGPKHRTEPQGEDRAPKSSLEAHVESVVAVAAPSASAEASPTASSKPVESAAASAAPGPSSEAPAPSAALAASATSPAPSGSESPVPPVTRTAPASAPGPGAPPSHRPAPSRGPANSGYKPGGI